MEIDTETLDISIKSVKGKNYYTWYGSYYNNKSYNYRKYSFCGKYAWCEKEGDEYICSTCINALYNNYNKDIYKTYYKNFDRRKK